MTTPSAVEDLMGRRIDRLGMDAEDIEAHLYGPGAALLSRGQRTEMKEALKAIHSDMAKARLQFAVEEIK